MISDHSEISQSYILKRMQYHSQIIGLSAIAPMMADTLRMVQYFDAQIRQAIYLLADAAKGETVDEQRTFTQEFSFPVFRTWWDHLKYDLREGRSLWLPKFIKKKLRVEYQNVVKKAEMQVSVKVTRSCPHAGFDWDNHMEKHLTWLLPQSFKPYDPTQYR